ncbi:MAG: HAMP domain-containing protein, partial [Planctomycetaceae bacterium]|jgi:two-component system phosphate regulon sensor histidine kinase PhoR|nr:HAMP domain-containing protein [Planctomycetaceae bacterium]
MKFPSFFTILFLGNLLLIGLILGFGFWYITNAVDQHTDNVSKQFQQQLLFMVRDELEESWHDTKNIVAQYCRSYSKMPEFRLTIVDTEGNVLGDSEYPAEKMEPHHTEQHPEIYVAFTGQQSESLRLSQTKRIHYRYIATPVRWEGKIVAVVRVAFPVADLAKSRRNIFFAVSTGFVLMLFVAVVLSVFLSWIWYKPLHVISSSARQIAEGNFEPILELPASRELVQLIDAINRMRNTVASQLETISRQRERLQTILCYLPDAVFALNSSNQVVYYNESAKAMFELATPSNPVPIQYLLRYTPILDFYFQEQEQDSASVTPKHVDIKFRDRKRSLELEKINISGENDRNEIAILLIINDLTAITETNRMKIDFVANTSHELRTPLTTIRATLDNIADGICDTPEMFRTVFAILNRHVARLEALTDDLLSLHDVEQESSPTRLETTTINEQKQLLEDLFYPKAADKGITLTIEPDKPDCLFLIDTKRLSLVLQNLVDNAVKFTPENGNICLTFSFEAEQRLVVRCQDTGCGIALEEQTRIFERFYRIKSSNGTRISGTGLGLAIVKHAVERLSGTLTLVSQPDQGSTFIVQIPIQMVSDE